MSLGFRAASKIFVLPVEKVVPIRMGEEDVAAVAPLLPATAAWLALASIRLFRPIRRPAMLRSRI